MVQIGSNIYVPALSSRTRTHAHAHAHNTDDFFRSTLVLVAGVQGVESAHPVDYDFNCHATVMQLSCNCHAILMQLSCNCHATVMRRGGGGLAGWGGGGE